MELSGLSVFTVKLIVLLLPGVIAALIVETLTIHKTISQFRFLVFSIVLGSTCYFCLSIFGGIWNFIAIYFGWSPITFSIQDSFLTESKPLSILEILLAIFVSIPLSLLVSLFISKRWFNRIGHAIGVTKKYGGDSVYYYAMEQEQVVWARARLFDQDIWYEGLIDSFSEDEDNKEIYLKSVVVYRISDSEKLYELESVYLSLSKNGVILEIPPVQ